MTITERLTYILIGICLYIGIINFIKIIIKKNNNGRKNNPS